MMIIMRGPAGQFPLRVVGVGGGRNGLPPPYDDHTGYVETDLLSEWSDPEPS